MRKMAVGIQQIKQQLQESVFLPNDERLIAMVHVYKVPRKRKGSYLCTVLNTSEVPVTAHVYQVKRGERSDVYKKKMCWLLRDLRCADGKSAKMMEEAGRGRKCDDWFEKERYTLLIKVVHRCQSDCCWVELSQRFLIQKPEFVNVPGKLFEDADCHCKLSDRTPSGSDLSVVGDDYHALSEKEQSDLELLMSECNIAMSNAELFTEQLLKQLSVLDGANIYSIVGSEDQVLNLMRLLDEGIGEAGLIEEKLNSYDQILESVKDKMEVMQDKESLVNCRNANHQRLLDHLEHLIDDLDLDMSHIDALSTGDLSTREGISRCTNACKALHKCLNTDLHPAMQRMAAVQERQKLCRKWCFQFSVTFAHHMNNQFIYQIHGSQVNGLTMSSHGSVTNLTIPLHTCLQQELLIYSDLMLWLKSVDETIFRDLTQVYTNSLRPVYQREITEFMDSAKQCLLAKHGKVKHGKELSVPTLSASTTNLTASVEAQDRYSSICSMDSASIYGSEPDLAAKSIFDQIFERILLDLERTCMAEQEFCFHFFHLDDKASFSDAKRDNQEGADVTFQDDIWQHHAAPPAGRQLNDRARLMMLELFPSLELELETFITFADKLDGLFSMFMLVRMSQRVINNQGISSFIGRTFGNCLIKVKRAFDKYIDLMIRSVGVEKVSKKQRCGVVGFVQKFEDFANLAQATFKNSDRHTDLNKAYARVVRVIFKQIEQVAFGHQKTPREVVLMENFHRLLSILSHLKKSGLDAERKEAKQLYVDNLQTYTVSLLGRPLGKLHTFFEGVEARVAAGVKREEVGFQLAFSKQELRKVIKEYPGKDVKKTLEHLYKKVEKQLCEEENLLQVVWHEMQNVFISQYKYYHQLMTQCYPDSQLALEFSIDDVLQFFSDIAQSH